MDNMKLVRFLVSGSTASMRRFAPRWPDRLGHLLTPANWNKPVNYLASGLPWAADNAAFSNFDPAAFRRMLAAIKGLRPALFVCCPDVVADARATLERFEQWSEETALAGHPLALVGQDGLEDRVVLWDRFGAYFVGGSDDFKLSQASADLVQEAKRRGKYVHMGRVNSERRIEAAAMMGCDSVDGTSASKFGDAHIPRFCRCIGRIKTQGVLFS